MRNEIPGELLCRVVERPTSVEGGGTRSLPYNTMAAALTNMAATKALQFSPEELTKLFGKCWKWSIKQQMIKRGIKCVIGMQGDTVYIWKRGA